MSLIPCPSLYFYGIYPIYLASIYTYNDVLLKGANDEDETGLELRIEQKVSKMMYMMVMQQKTK